MRRRLIPLLAILALLTTACASKAPVRPTQAEPPPVKTVRLGIYGLDNAIDTVIAAFQDAHPDYRVEKVPIGQASVLMAKAASGEIDLVPNFLNWEQLVDKSLLADLSPFVTRDRFDVAPLGLMMQREMVNGHIYALPISGKPYVFAYNAKLVADAGVTIPSAWTWEQFQETVGRLTRSKGDEKIWGFDWGDDYPEHLAQMQAMQQIPNGADGPDLEVGRKVLTFWNSMVSNGLVPPALPIARRGETTHYFFQGKACLTLMPLGWLMNSSVVDHYAMAPFPTQPGTKPVVFVAPVSFAIAAKAENPAGAWAFLSFAAGPVGATIRAKHGEFPLYASDQTRSAWAESTPPPPPGSDMLFDVTWYSPKWDLKPNTLEGAFWQASTDVLTGTAPFDNAISAYELHLSNIKGK